MTLYDRVRRAGNMVSTANGSSNELLAKLRDQLQGRVSVDDLAYLARENPEQARNEVRSACRIIFDGEGWEYVGADARQALVAQLVDSIFGFGVLEDMLNDDGITEIIVNGPDKVFYERDGKLYPSARRFASSSELRALIDRILGPLGRRIDEASPMVDARLPQGHRVNVVLPPVGIDGPYVTIRKFAEHVMTLEEMHHAGSVEGTVKTFLEWAVRARKSIAVSGGTGSGKTTLLNALSCVIPEEERIVTIEDSAELRFLSHPDVVRLEARPKNSEGLGEISIRNLVINSLRMRPDRIIVGECRGAEALDMLQAMNTGHDGSLTTLHANSPAESISRLTTMVRYEADLPVDVIEANIANAIDLVVQTRREADGSRCVSEIVSLGLDGDKARCATRQIYLRDRGRPQGVWESVPAWIGDLVGQGVVGEEEVSQWKRACSLG